MNMSLFDRNGTLCESELIRRATLCQECMSEHCIFNPQGICLVPFVFGRAPELTDEGCLDWVCNEERS